MYYLELMFAFMNTFQLQKLMKKSILTEILSLEKGQEALEKKLNCNFITINPGKEIMTQTMKSVVEYKHLLVNLKIRNYENQKKN